MSHKIALLLLITCALGCSTGTPEKDAPPETEDSTQNEFPVVTITGAITSGLGDATSTYTATLSGDSRRVGHIDETLEVGEYGSHRARYVLEQHALRRYTQEGWRAVLDPDRAGARDSVRVEASWDAFGQLQEIDLRINDRAEASGPAEVEGPRRHLEVLRLDIAKQISQRHMDTHNPSGVYTASLPAASSPGRTLTLDLYLSHDARLSTDYQNGEAPIVQRGIWTALPDSTVLVVFTTKDHAWTAASALEFSVDGDHLNLVEPDDAYGSEGLHLVRTRGPVPDELLAHTWAWVAFVSPVESERIAEPERYTLTFRDTGRLHLRADCNRGGTTALLGESGGFSITPLGTTRAACEPGSQAPRFTQLLQRAVHWFVRDGSLYLELPADSGVLQFQAVP